MEDRSKGMKVMIMKTWERCRSSIGRKSGANKSCSPETQHARIRKTKSWPGDCAAPSEGCFSVYVGPQRERFAVKTEYANHPLFRMLLEEAESEYGFSSHGPLALPCNVDLFVKVLIQMYDDDNDHHQPQPQGCLLSPSKFVSFGKFRGPTL